MSITISLHSPPPSSGTARPLLYLLHLYPTIFSSLLLILRSLFLLFLQSSSHACKASACSSFVSPFLCIHFIDSVHFVSVIPFLICHAAPLLHPLFCLFLHSLSSLKTLPYLFHLPAGLGLSSVSHLIVLHLIPHTLFLTSLCSIFSPSPSIFILAVSE